MKPYDSSKQISSKYNFMQPNWNQGGVSDGYAEVVDYDKASAYVDPILLDIQQMGGSRIYMGQIVPGGTYEFGQGSLSAPGIRWAADTDTGFYWESSGVFSVAINGTKEVTFNSSGIAIADLTQGSVLFAGASGQISQDNTNFSFNDTTDALTIGGNYLFKSGTAFTGTLDHAISADRTWTLPDVAGTVALGTGAANRVGYWSGTNELTSSANLTFDGTVLTALQYARIGTATDATAHGDFSAGLTSAARMFYDQSVPILYLYNSAGAIVSQVSGVAATGTVFNEVGADIDFRVEGDTATDLLFVDASLDRVGINTSGPDRRLDVADSSGTQIRLTYTDGSVYSEFGAGPTGSSWVGVPSSAGNYVFQLVYTAADLSASLGTYMQVQAKVSSVVYIGNFGVDRYGDTTGCLFISTNAPAGIILSGDNNNRHWKIAATGGLTTGGNYRFSHGTSALATNATEGFFHLNSCAGTPTGTPASIPTGQIPMVFDSTNNKLYAYDTAWVDLTASGSGTLDQAYDSGGAGAGRTITVDSGSVTLTGGGTTVGGFTVNGSRTIASAASAVWDEVLLDADVSISGSTNITTAAGFNFVTIKAPTITDVGTVGSIDLAATVAIEGAPVGSGVTINNAYALWVSAGRILGDGGILVGGEPSGVSGKVGYTNTVDNSANSTGTGTIRMKGTTNRTTSGFLKFLDGTTARYIPYFDTITG